MNESMYAKYGLQAATSTDSMGLAPTLIHGAVAAVADFGTTVWNSLPMTEEVTTSDLLSRIDNDALQVYNEHPDAVHAASFIGGSFVPVGIAMKGLSLYRNGSKAVNFYTKAGEVSQLKKVEDAFNASINASSEAVKAEKWALYGQKWGAAAVDSIAAEAAIVGTMNAHPYMEDYNKDFGSNFAFWAAVGTGIGGAIGHIGAIALTRDLTHSLEKDVRKEIFEGYTPVEEATHSGEQFQIMSRNIDYWQGKLDRNKIDSEYKLTPRTEAELSYMVDREKGKMDDAFSAMATGELKEASVQVRDAISARFMKDARFREGDKISFYKPSTILDGTLTKEIPTKEAPTFSKMFKVKDKEVLGAPKVTYLPEHDAFVSHKAANSFTSLADTGKSIESLTAEGKKISHRFMHADIGFELQKMSTHLAEEVYAKTFLKYATADVKMLNETRVDLSDLPTLKALATRVSTLPAAEQAIVKVTASGGKVLSSEAIINIARDLTMAEIRTQAKMGAAIETISLRTNTPLETVRAIVTNTESQAGLFKFQSTEDIVKALDPTKRAITVQTNLKKVQNANVSASLNIADKDAISSELSDFHMAQSQSSMVKEIAAFFSTEDSITKSKLLQQEISNITSSGLISTFFTSTNRALEKFGFAGNIALNMGKDVTALTNQLSKNFIEPIDRLGKEVLKSQAATMEHNIALNHNASLKNWRIYDEETGKIYQKVKGKDAEGKNVITLVPSQLNGKDFQIVDENVKALFAAYQKAGREMYDLKNLKNRTYGRSDIQDLGFWVPAFNPRDKQIAYAFNRVTNTTTLLHARTPGELGDAVAAYKKNLPADSPISVHMKGDDLINYNKMAGRHDPMYMAVADISLQHGGSSSSTLVKTNVEPMSDVINAYEHYLRSGVDDVVELKFQPVMDQLSAVSMLSTIGYEKGTLGVIGKLTKSVIDPGQVMRNAILGKSNLGEHRAWMEHQQTGQAFVDMSIKKLTDIMSPVLMPVKNTLFGVRSAHNLENWNIANAQLEKNGFMPFKAADDFTRYMNEGTIHAEASTPRMVALSNSLAATMLLRFMDIAQPLVNIVSLPILTSGAVSRRLQASFMDGALDPNAKFTMHQVMFDGIRLFNHPTEGDRIRKLAISKNLFKADVLEANGVLTKVRSLEGGILSKTEDLLQSKVVEWASTAANKSESLVREATFFMGWGLAKKAYPGISDTGAMTFARSFMDESLGNYTASQRPSMFQGTFGVAMGLFQTYMLTLAQHMYRQIETKDWAALGKMMLTQSSVFGISSLPGFHQVSEAIGTHMSDNHYDLETGTFRALPDELSNILLYGTMSSYGPGINTRGDIQPRIPTPLTLDTLAAVNLTKQSYIAGERLVKAAFTADGNTGRAMLEALSLQSISRPMARMAELLPSAALHLGGVGTGGKAITGAGELVSSDAEIWTTQGIMSRILATRPLREIKAREAFQLNSVYGAADSDNRREAAKALKTMIRSGDINDEKVQELQYEYMRSGSAQGWRNVIRDAMKEDAGSGAENVRNRFKPNAVYNLLVDDLEH